MTKTDLEIPAQTSESAPKQPKESPAEEPVPVAPEVQPEAPVADAQAVEEPVEPATPADEPTAPVEAALTWPFSADQEPKKKTPLAKKPNKVNEAIGLMLAKEPKARFTSMVVSGGLLGPLLKLGFAF